MDDHHGQATSVSVVHGLSPQAVDPARLTRAFAIAFGCSLLIFAPSYACLAGSTLGCADGYVYKFANRSGEAVTITPFHLDDEGRPFPLVVHGFQRGRFALEASGTLDLLLEVGDFTPEGVVVEFPDGAIRVMPFGEQRDLQDPVLIESPDQGAYREAPEIAAVHSSWSLGLARLKAFALFVLLPPLLIALIATSIALVRAHDVSVASQ